MEQLENSLDQCRTLLREHGEEFWADKIDSVLRSHLSPYYFAKEVKSWFGGMGSFSDLIICPENQHRIDPRHVDSVNEQLRSLQACIYEQANDVSRHSV